MENIKYKIVLLCLGFVFIVFPVFAHPGRTASDGCHYCRTNCSKWGEVAGARHCHSGYTAPVQEYLEPTNTPRPLPTWTQKPTKKPTRIPPTPTKIQTPTRSPSPTLTKKPTVNKSQTTVEKPTKKPSNSPIPQKAEVSKLQNEKEPSQGLFQVLMSVFGW